MKVRRAGPRDAGAIVELVNHVMSVRRTVDWFMHLHYGNPAGKSVLWLAEDAGRVVAFRSIVPAVARYGTTRVLCGQLADASTDPDYRGQGLFSSVNESAINEFLAGGGDLVFGFPGPMTYSRQIRQFGFVGVGEIPQLMLPLTPSVARAAPPVLRPGVRLIAKVAAKSSRPVIPVGPVSLEDISFAELPGLSFVRDKATVQWRAAMPGRNYWLATLDSRNFVLLGETTRLGIGVCTIVDSRTSSSRNLGILLRSAARWGREQGFEGLYAWRPNRGTGVYLVQGFVPTFQTTKFIVRFSDEHKFKELRRVKEWNIRLLDADAY